MGFFSDFIPPRDRYAALLLYGMMVPQMFLGYDGGIMAVILADKQFISYYNLDLKQIGVVASVPWASIGFAYLFIGGPLANYVGRLWAMRISALTIIIGVIVQVIPNTYPVLVVGRLIAGFGCGAIYIAQVSYVTECAPTSLRGSIVGTTGSFGYQLGVVFAFWIGFGMSFAQSPVNIAWRVSNVLQIPIGVLAITMSFWYPESPRFLLEKYNDNPGLCLAALARLRSGTPEDDHVRTEFHELVASLAARSDYESGFVGLFKDRSMRKRLAFGIYATSLQTIGGIATINIYAARIYESLGWTKGHQALGLNGCLGIFQLLSVLISTFTVDRFGRRRLLLLGFGIQSLALLICASLTTSFPENDNRLAAIFEVMMLFIVGLSYYWSDGPLPSVVASEIFPQHVRSHAFGVSNIGLAAVNIALTQSWPVFNEKVGGRSYWLLFALNAFALWSVYLILPETKGISLESMDQLFGEVGSVGEVRAEQIEQKVDTIEKAAYSCVVVNPV